MTFMFGTFAVLGFIFGLLAFTQLDELKKRVAALEAERMAPRP